MLNYVLSYMLSAGKPGSHQKTSRGTFLKERSGSFGLPERYVLNVLPNNYLGRASILPQTYSLCRELMKAEETPSAILLAHAALLSARKQARRRATLFYFFAANRLEKCGIVSKAASRSIYLDIFNVEGVETPDDVFSSESA
jgi:hypothetical protein